MSPENLEVAPRRAAIENLPHLAEKMCRLWRSADFDAFVHGVLLDSREGARQGLPPEVAQEMVFVARLANMVRVMEASPLVPVDVDAAGQIVAAARPVGSTGIALDAIPWTGPGARGESVPSCAGAGKNPVWSARNRLPTAKKSASPLEVRPPVPPAAAATVPTLAGSAVQGRTHHYLSLFLNETPPMPARLRLDLSRPAGLQNGQADAMSRELFRCISGEAAQLGVEELALSHLGCADQCPWLAEAVRFAKRQCNFHQVSLHVDLLNASEAQLAEAIAQGLDSLVVDCNLHCANWRERALAEVAVDAHFFSLRLARLLQKRDENFARSGHRCVIKLAQTGQAHSHVTLSPVIARLTDMVDACSVEWLPDSGGRTEAVADGGLCWTPFVEANVRVDGHLVVCTHDHQGFSYVADLKQTEFPQAWHSATFRETRRELLAGKPCGGLCSSCPRAV